MAWDKGFNFREADYTVTDGTNTTWVVANTTYPTTRNGVTFGWESPQPNYGGACNPPSATGDVRLYGYNGIDASQNVYFRVDLPNTGIFNVLGGLGFGGDPTGVPDASSTKRQQQSVYDNATQLVGIGCYMYAAGGTEGYVAGFEGTARPPADWVSYANSNSTNVWKSLTFTSTILKVRLPSSSPGFEMLNHLFLHTAGGATFQPAWAAGSNQLLGGLN